MATTTATITLSSADLLSDNLSLSATMNLNKGGTEATGLDQFRMERFKIATGTQFDLIEATTAASEDANYVYVCNKNTEFPNLRKIVFVLMQNEEMHIHSMSCQCNDSNKHKQYYYEWAL